MQIDTEDHDIPLWIVWGWTTSQGEMSILNIALNYRHAKYTYECEKDNPNYLRVWVEPTHGNHSISGRHLYPNLGMIDMVRQDIESSWQDRYARAKAYASEFIRNVNNPKRFSQLAAYFRGEFGMSQENIDIRNESDYEIKFSG